VAFGVVGCPSRPSGSGSTQSEPAPSASVHAPVVSASSDPRVGPSSGAIAAEPDVRSVRPEPVGGKWLSCYAHFQPRTQPELDARRLGQLCGPPNGMRRVAAAGSDVEEGSRGREHRWKVRSGECFRVFAVAEPAVADLDVEVFGPLGKRFAFDTTDDRWPVVKPDGPFCLVRAGEYRAVVRAQRGSGRYAIEIWRLH